MGRFLLCGRGACRALRHTHISKCHPIGQLLVPCAQEWRPAPECKSRSSVYVRARLHRLAMHACDIVLKPESTLTVGMPLWRATSRIIMHWQTLRVTEKHLLKSLSCRVEIQAWYGLSLYTAVRCMCSRTLGFNFNSVQYLEFKQVKTKLSVLK